MANFENITTSSVEYSDAIFEKRVNFVGTFILVADESVKCGFEITCTSGDITFDVLKITGIRNIATYDPPADKFI